MTNIDKLHEMVKSSLFQFVNKHIKAADLSVVDEIVLNYVIAILEEATEDPSFDVDGEFLFFLFLFSISISYFSQLWILMNISISGFVEMMSAYFPDFSQIETAKVCEWIFELANEMSKKKNNTESNSTEASIK